MKNAKKRVDLPGGVSIEISGPEDAVERFLLKMQREPVHIPYIAPAPIVIERPYRPYWSGPYPSVPWGAPFGTLCSSSGNITVNAIEAKEVA